MPAPFEDPAKTELVDRTKIAVQSAAHDLVEELARLDLPEHLKGVLQGDLQSLTHDGDRFCYVVRPGTMESLPTFIANWARACHEMDGVKFYVVVEAFEPEFEDACRTAGAGLLQINDANGFDHIVDFDDVLPAELDAALQERASELRSEMFTKRDLKLAELSQRFSQIGKLTQGMDEETATLYTAEVSKFHQTTREWGEEIGLALDRATADSDGEALELIAKEIDTGPIPSVGDDG